MHDHAAERLDAYDHNDVTVPQALAFLSADWPHLRLLELRQAPSEAHVEEARSLLGARPPPWLVEAFVARPREAMGDHAGALRERLDALPGAPRWEGVLAAHLLTRIGQGALRTGQPTLAVDATRRAVRLLPFEPTALVALADALGDAPEAAGIRAWLWDTGVGPDALPGTPTAADRAATARPPSLEDLEPLTDEDRARYAVYSLNDPSLVDTVTGTLQHAAIQLRCRQRTRTRETLLATRLWEPTGSTALQWLGFEGDALHRDRTRTVLLDLLSGPAGPVDEDDGGLLDAFVGARQSARLGAPDHPLVRRAAAIEAENPTLAHLYHGDPRELYGQARSLAPLWGPGREPALARAIRAWLSSVPAGDHTPFLEPARAARPACKGCKAPFAPRELQLRIPEPFQPLAKATCWHPGCATRPAHRAARTYAESRWRNAPSRA